MAWPRTAVIVSVLVGGLALASCQESRPKLPPLPLPTLGYLPPGSTPLSKPSEELTIGRPGWLVTYRLPGSPRPNPNYSFRWLAVNVVTGSVLPKLSGQSVVRGHGSARAVEVGRRATVLGHPGMVYTSSSPGGELEIEWLARGIVSSVSTCTACRLPMTALLRVALRLKE
jgi:hypothetical protein